MIRKAYAIKDEKIGVYKGPFLFHNNAEALRSFGTEVKENKESELNKYPADFSMWLIGEYDDSIGKLIDQENFCVGRAMDFVVHTPQVVS